MSLRVPVDLDRRLEKLAAEEHTSKSALLLQGGGVGTATARTPTGDQRGFGFRDESRR
ncbi:ribbon-helix-helix protein, CopG family [Paenarthrobacter nitroguajacolicus]|uniref:ribbon-helix-helix protein, CopG family n=1 Tax=Paenarthrobacter nitroguajacolicus TaxID=211146 RepID=UPI00248BBBB0|nr:ribbon-helix-helix protein, CopG family [Paenarthrobacter nitroguajacolicus]